MTELTPTEDLIIGVLVARTRMGETLWTFDSKLKNQLGELESMGLITTMHGIVGNTIRARLTDKGKAEHMMPGYRPTNPPVRVPGAGAYDGSNEGLPGNAYIAMRQLADWLDEADKLIDHLYAANGRVRPNGGDEVQQDLRAMAEWFRAHPGTAAKALAYVQLVEIDEEFD